MIKKKETNLVCRISEQRNIQYALTCTSADEIAFGMLIIEMAAIKRFADVDNFISY